MAAHEGSRFREFEHAGWESAEVCATYQERLGGVVAQVIGPMLDAARVDTRDSVLDVATGSGEVAAAAAERGASVAGVDFSAEMLRRAAANHPHLKFERGDADALPFAAMSFNVVVCNFGVPHFPDPEAFFRESLRVLRPLGRFAFTVWAAPAETKGFEAIYGAVQRHGSLDVGLPAGPNFFLYADANTAQRSLVEVGFESVTSRLVPQTWEFSALDDAFESILNGTVRAAALLKRQPAEVVARIRDSVRQAISAYAVNGGYRVPMPAVLTSGTKPAT
jgi:ubiquinone/menaquinone biosynthesis C-methylase UbiE